jgi:mannose-6-phosphate isomerase-like protein (cupin superfamily)
MRYKKTIKPWGYEKLIFENPFYRIKMIHIKKGHRLSKQYHKFKWETLIMKKDDNKMCFHDIPPRMIHRLDNTKGKTDMDIIEISYGSDEDIIRLEDDYGRK